MEIITGGIHVDKRGEVSFVNSFDMTTVKRMYHLKHMDVDVIRAWQGHQIEHKWFFCTKGSWIINVIEVYDWTNPAKSGINHMVFHLSETGSSVLSVPRGNVTGIKATKKDSRVMVYSDQELQASKDDDFRYPIDYWRLKLNNE